jgi:hypothetical protein
MLPSNLTVQWLTANKESLEVRSLNTYTTVRNQKELSLSLLDALDRTSYDSDSSESQARDGILESLNVTDVSKLLVLRVVNIAPEVAQMILSTVPRMLDKPVDLVVVEQEHIED